MFISLSRDLSKYKKSFALGPELRFILTYQAAEISEH